MGCGNPNDVEDAQYNSAIFKKILHASKNLDVIGTDNLPTSLPTVENENDFLWTPLAMHLFRLIGEVPAVIGARTDRLDGGGYIAYAKPTHGKTYTALWLLKKLKSLPEHKRPRGFMVSGDGRKQGENYASFLARSLNIDPNVEPGDLAGLIVTALTHEKTKKKMPIMILDNFDWVTADDENFTRGVGKRFLEHGITLLILCQTTAAANTLTKVNGWTRIQGFPGLCTQPRYNNHGEAILVGWTPVWTDTSWTYILLTQLVQNCFPDDTWDIDHATGYLSFLSDHPPTGVMWNPNSVLSRAQSICSQSPRHVA